MIPEMRPIAIDKNYFRGIMWFMASLCICESNDVITKYLEHNLSPLQVVFGRFFFSTLLLLPFMIHSTGNFRTRHWKMNFMRGLILFLGMFIWCYGLDASQLNIACLINFTTPMFTLLLAALILKEKIGKTRIVATIAGFLGVAVVLNPWTTSFPILTASLFLLSAIFFAVLDIFNKILVSKETPITSLFYTGLFTMIFASIPLMIPYFLKHDRYLVALNDLGREIALIGIKDIFLLTALGLGANLLMFCILKSFSYIDVSATAPFRYVELILASVLGYLFFGETIAASTILGAMIIVPSVIYLVRFESRVPSKSSLSEKQTLTHCC
ncbi:MAG: DMT family transporter [Puniceicoccales bacterium]|jgi:S-adenosylmethionine uptake transporter|nr:DMT family transporter [Puniceicoccales bacterium]